jgi:hypothetical protein
MKQEAGCKMQMKVLPLAGDGGGIRLSDVNPLLEEHNHPALTMDPIF